MSSTGRCYVDGAILAQGSCPERLDMTVAAWSINALASFDLESA